MPGHPEKRYSAHGGTKKDMLTATLDPHHGHDNRRSSRKAETSQTHKFKRGQHYEEGELEQEFLRRVAADDTTWVMECLNYLGKDIMFSKWAGGLTQTCVFYPAKKGNTDMLKILVAYGGKPLLTVQDIKGRTPAKFAQKHGIDIDTYVMENTDTGAIASFVSCVLDDPKKVRYVHPDATPVATPRTPRRGSVTHTPAATPMILTPRRGSAS